MICVNTFASPMATSVTYKTLYFNNLYLYEFYYENLQISYIGMQTQEVAIKPNLKVILKSDTELLDEVTVVAYGTKRKQDLVRLHQ